MSELKTNKIQTNDTNNVAIDNPMQLKSYSTTDRNSLTSVAGDMIYNSTDNKPQYYDGSDWQDMVDPTIEVDFLVIGGGASGAPQHGGGGGAGGYRTSYGSDTSGRGSTAESSQTLLSSTNYTVTVGAGGAAFTGTGSSEGTTYGNEGSNSVFADITSNGGGSGGSWQNHGGESGGCGGGGATINGAGGSGTSGQGYDGGNGGPNSTGNDHPAGGGGGAGSAGSDGTEGYPGSGGNGLASTITGSSVTRAGGGGGGGYRNDPLSTGRAGSGGTGGGGTGGLGYSGQNQNLAATAGTVNTGSGGGGNGLYSSSYSSGAGGSGIVILRFPSSKTITIGAGLTSSSATVGNDTVVTFTAGTGNVSWS